MFLKYNLVRLFFYVYKLLISFFQNFTNKDSIILMDSIGEPEVNPTECFPLFLKMKERNFKVYYALNNKNELYFDLKKDNLIDNTFIINSNKYLFYFVLFFYLVKAKKVVFSFGWEMNLHKILFNNKYIESIYIQHGTSFFKRKICVPGGYINSLKYNKIFASGKFDYDLLIKIVYCLHHVMVKGTFNIEFDKEVIYFANQKEINYYLENSNLLITDFSSISFDFLYMQKPVIYYPFHVTKEVVIEEDEIFNVFRNEEEVVNKIKYYDNSDYILESENIKKLDKFYFYKKNCIENTIEELTRDLK